MQLHAMPSEVTLGTNAPVTAFKMAGNAKAFKVLSDTLYQNKIGSMVRETSCNASDSHQQTGKADVPFEIHLPDMFEPYFSVRDYGLGLNAEGVINTFSTYFHSTKENDNNLIGAFGLGSKTPFAYTDAFTVTAIYAGIRREFTAFINSDGIPSLTMLSEDATDEVNGVEITVPVTSQADFARFRNEVRNQLKFFPVKPVILNYAEGIDYPNFTEDKDFITADGIRIGGSGSELRGIWLVQGGVGYPLDTNNMGDNLSPDNRDFLNIIGRHSAIIDFTLGDIEVTPSRETISYSARTIANIQARLDTVRAAIRPKVESLFAAIEGEAWNVAVKFNDSEVVRRLAASCGLKPAFDHFTMVNGYMNLDVNSALNIDNVKLDDIDDGDETSDDDYGVALETAKLFYRIANFDNRWVQNSRRHRWMPNGYATLVRATSNVTVYVRDTDNKPVLRYREALNTAKGRPYLLERRDSKAFSPEEIEALRARLGGIPLVLLSSIELDEVKRAGRSYTPPSCYEYDTSIHSISTSFDWERRYDKVAEIEAAYYVLVYRHTFLNADKCKMAVLANFAKAGLLDRPIIAIREKDLPKVINNPEWIHVDAAGEEYVEATKANRTAINSYLADSVHHQNSGYVLDDDLIEVIKAGIADGRLPQSVLEEPKTYNSFKERFKARATARGVTDLASQNIHVIRRWDSQFAHALDTRKEKLQKTVRNHYKTVDSHLIEQFPLLRILNEANYVDGKYYRMRDAEVAAEIIGYMANGRFAAPPVPVVKAAVPNDNDVDNDDGI